jgi:hypothetical protein
MELSDDDLFSLACVKAYLEELACIAASLPPTFRIHIAPDLAMRPWPAWPVGPCFVPEPNTDVTGQRVLEANIQPALDRVTNLLNMVGTGWESRLPRPSNRPDPQWVVTP